RYVHHRYRVALDPADLHPARWWAFARPSNPGRSSGRHGAHVAEPAHPRRRHCRGGCHVRPRQASWTQPRPRDYGRACKACPCREAPAVRCPGGERGSAPLSRPGRVETPCRTGEPYRHGGNGGRPGVGQRPQPRDHGIPLMVAAGEAMTGHADIARALAADMPRLAASTNAETVVLRLADALACALGAEALAEKAGGIVRIVAQARFTAGSGASVWWSGADAAAGTAALRNAVAVRFLDYNDTYVGRAIVHPSDMIPALVALAEERGAPWERLIEAISVAYEALCRIADVVNLRKHGFDGSTLSSLGVAAGAAWLLDLSEQAATEAIRLAALDAGMLRVVRQGRLSDWKTVASGRGAVKGPFAARMAE